MEYNYTSIIEAKTEDKLSVIYEKAIKLFKEYARISELAMICMQSKGYNGFKRWHRYRNREFNNFALILHNELFDRFHKVVSTDIPTVTYAPQSMNVHLMTWREKLNQYIDELGECNKEFYTITGTDNCIIECAIKVLAKDYEKVCRYYNRFAEGDWLIHDMHIVDDCIHEKYKKKEERHGY